MPVTGERARLVRRFFDEAAPDYDRIAGLMALGSGRRYRRQALQRAGLQPGMRVLDVAIGTGLTAREARGVVGPAGRVVGVDVSLEMIARAVATLSVPVAQGRAEQLPLRPAAFDFVSLGYALRHLDDLAVPFAEFFRVLSPGGVVCILEITKPERSLAAQALRLYIGGVMPVVARIAAWRAVTADLWRYYWRTIEGAPPPGAVLEALAAAGFQAPRRHLAQGIFSEYTARKPVAAPCPA